MWSATAWEVDRSYAAGCPFSAHLGLGIPVAGGGDDLLVEVRASDASRGELVDYEPLVNGGIRLRYGSCKGGILLDAGRASELHLVAIDQQGRRVPMPGSLELVAPGPAPRDGMRWTAALAADERRVVACSTRQGRRWEGLYGFGLVALSFMVGGWWLVTGRMPARAGAVKE
jgi:hypothetical protein